MGVKLIILLGLLIGVLYCIHILVKDYQAITAAKVFRLIFKRDLTSPSSYKAHVRWGKILQYDTIQCTRYLFCDLGASEIKTHLREDFIYMLALEAREEDVTALEVFKNAYNYGKSSRKEINDPCRAKYSACPFKVNLLYEFIQYLLRIS
ncbi:unnamed protein product [Pieris macdunnoughi]|uniref:Uncharacterized protein n=1 Tax=Pieris macdunnoughi TaxID=345717 RepID=A0A821RTF9_9NEOP|nr:unnamed protein product [Pieris macdunnoughi]